MFEITLEFSPSYYGWQLDGERWTAIFTTSKANWAFFTTWIWQVARQVKVLVAHSCPTLCNPWTVDCQVPLAMGFSRQEYWSGLPFPSLGNLPDPGVKPGSPALQADSLSSETPRKPWTHVSSQHPLLWDWMAHKMVGSWNSRELGTLKTLILTVFS